MLAYFRYIYLISKQQYTNVIVKKRSHVDYRFTFDPSFWLLIGPIRQDKQI